ALGAAPVGPEGGFFEDRVPLAQAQAAHDDRALPAGIDDDIGRDVARGTIFCLNADAGRARTVEQDLQHADALVNIDAVLASIFEHELVELATAGLRGLRGFV